LYFSLRKQEALQDKGYLILMILQANQPVYYIIAVP